ncbi:MAG: malate synthase A [Chloroflexaceae bacterium]|jgi:malate synthase|nr:malate synthase A [Chloroflexaceae bacterium]MCE2852392.1 malate synthase A [Chloroflexaceae bacterium]
MTATLQVIGAMRPGYDEILTPAALAFVAELIERFEPRRHELLAQRQQRWAELKAGRLPDFDPATAHIRNGDWHVIPPPPDFRNRRTEITGPVDRKMVINALNSGAQVFMSDFEDANAPLWDNVVQGQINLRDAIRRTISLSSDGKEYRLNDTIATLAVRARGWHLEEKHVLYNSKPISGGIFDFGLYFFHNAHELIARGSGPYFYLPKLQNHREARLWNDIFVYAQDRLNIAQGTIRATVLIEHILAAFEMDEILYELRNHSSGLNHGRWDYIYSFIKAFNHRDDFVLPDRAQVTMGVHFLRSAAELVAATCHKRGAHALGGMSAIIPRKDDVAANEKALSNVRADKQREASQGFDGAWVAHPGLVTAVQEVFNAAFSGDNQIERVPQVAITAADLLAIPTGDITEAGLRNNISVALQYIEAWFGGRGAVAINFLMEDVATAEISRSQIWQWLHHHATLADGRPVTAALYAQIRDEEVTALQARLAGPRLEQAVKLLDELVLNPEFVEFLTVPGYQQMA